jgi:hypothetical protein
MKPLFDFATNRIETERAKLTELTPADEVRRRWESVGPDEPPSAILDFDRCPEITRDEEHPEYGLVKGLPPRSGDGSSERETEIPGGAFRVIQS